MARRPRGVIVHAVVHVTARGNRGSPIFMDEGDYRAFLRDLQDLCGQHGARVHAYCLMTNHLHLLVQVGERPLSPVMRALLHSHARRINRLYYGGGHVFGDRFWSRPCTSESDVLSTIRYIHANPVEAGLVDAPDAYPWSSHRIYLGQEEAPWVSTSALEFFSADRARAQAAYAVWMAGGLSEAGAKGGTGRPRPYGGAGIGPARRTRHSAGSQEYPSTYENTAAPPA
ncbi:MAG: transposase [Armatimonadota bacterium]|nr:transposase [Armatimonadota bacterium]MDR7403945.1 transposase [Armatimonadota bacterium]